MSKAVSKRLGDLINLKRGYDLPEHQRRPGPYPVISSAGVTGYHDEYMVEGKGVVTGRYGTLGEMYYVDGKYWPHNTALYVTTFKDNDPRYIYYLLSALGRIRTSDKSAVPGVNRNELHEIAVPAIVDKNSRRALPQSSPASTPRSTATIVSTPNWRRWPGRYTTTGSCSLISPTPTANPTNPPAARWLTTPR